MDDSIDIGNKVKQKGCFAFQHDILAPLRIVYNKDYVLFWNKYQLFVYENINFKESSREYVPDFQIHQVIASNNNIICLDTGGNIHTTSIQNKKTTSKKFKITFQSRAQNVLALFRANDNDNMVCTLQFEYDSFFFCIHKANTEFHQSQRNILNISEEEKSTPLLKNVILTSHTLVEGNFDYLSKYFLSDYKCKDCSLICLSLDRRSVYGCLISLKATDDHYKLLKLYTCPSEICDIKIEVNNEITLVIGLVVGTIIKLPLKSKIPSIFYLNTALHKFETIKKVLIYTDGASLWKCKDITSLDSNLKLLPLKLVNDFIIIGDSYIVTTYSNIIYSLDDNEEVDKVIPEEDRYTSADKVLNNVDALDKILEEIENNKLIVKRLEQEKYYLTALSLSNRQDIVSGMVKCIIHIYNDYQNVVAVKNSIILAEKMEEYFKNTSILVAIQLDTTEFKKHFDKMFNNLKKLKLHVTVESCGRILKTNSLNVKMLSENPNILIPIDSGKCFNEIKVYIKILTQIPGVYNEKTNTWVVLYKNCTILKSEKFIKFDNELHQLSTKDTQDIGDLLTKTAINTNGNLFKVQNILQDQTSWALYIRLPKHFEKIFEESVIFDEEFNLKQAKILKDKLSCEDFLLMKSSITLHILQTTVTLQIVKEEFIDNYKLKITSKDLKTAFNLRTFLSRLISNFDKENVIDNAFVDSKLYTLTENLQKQFRNPGNNMSENLLLFDEFHKNVIGDMQV